MRSVLSLPRSRMTRSSNRGVHCCCWYVTKLECQGAVSARRQTKNFRQTIHLVIFCDLYRSSCPSHKVWITRCPAIFQSIFVRVIGITRRNRFIWVLWRESNMSVMWHNISTLSQDSICCVIEDAHADCSSLSSDAVPFGPLMSARSDMFDRRWKLPPFSKVCAQISIFPSKIFESEDKGREMV